MLTTGTATARILWSISPSAIQAKQSSRGRKHIRESPSVGLRLIRHKVKSQSSMYYAYTCITALSCKAISFQKKVVPGLGVFCSWGVLPFRPKGWQIWGRKERMGESSGPPSGGLRGAIKVGDNSIRSITNGGPIVRLFRSRRVCRLIIVRFPVICSEPMKCFFFFLI